MTVGIMDSEEEYEYDSEDSEYEEEETDGETDEEEEEGCQYEVLDIEQVSRLMMDKISEVNEVLKISPTTVRLLLNKSKWNTQVLFENYCNEEDPGGSPALCSSIPADTSDNGDIVCEICCLDVPVSKTRSLLECGHGY